MPATPAVPVLDPRADLDPGPLLGRPNTPVVELGLHCWVPGRVLHPQQRDVFTEPRPRTAQPTRSANTEAGMIGNSASSSRTPGSNPSKHDGPAARTHLGGRSAASARATVARSILRCFAIARFDMPWLACRCRISAQSSTLITHPSWLGSLPFEEHYWPSSQGALTLTHITMHRSQSGQTSELLRIVKARSCRSADVACVDRNAQTA